MRRAAIMGTRDTLKTCGIANMKEKRENVLKAIIEVYTEVSPTDN